MESVETLQGKTLMSDIQAHAKLTTETCLISTVSGSVFNRLDPKNWNRSLSAASA